MTPLRIKRLTRDEIVALGPPGRRWDPGFSLLLVAVVVIMVIVLIGEAFK